MPGPSDMYASLTESFLPGSHPLNALSPASNPQRKKIIARSVEGVYHAIPFTVYFFNAFFLLSALNQMMKPYEQDAFQTASDRVASTTQGIQIMMLFMLVFSSFKAFFSGINLVAHQKIQPENRFALRRDSVIELAKYSYNLIWIILFLVTKSHFNASHQALIAAGNAPSHDLVAADVSNGFNLLFFMGPLVTQHTNRIIKTITEGFNAKQPNAENEISTLQTGMVLFAKMVHDAQLKWRHSRQVTAQPEDQVESISRSPYRPSSV